MNASCYTILLSKHESCPNGLQCSYTYLGLAMRLWTKWCQQLHLIRASGILENGDVCPFSIFCLIPIYGNGKMFLCTSSWGALMIIQHLVRKSVHLKNYVHYYREGQTLLFNVGGLLHKKGNHSSSRSDRGLCTITLRKANNLFQKGWEQFNSLRLIVNASLY